MAAATKLPLQSSTAHNSAAAAAVAGKKTIEEIYQKKSQLEHILLRPDTYIGSIEKHTQTLWVFDNDEMVHRPVTYVPGLYKIFDEILVNAADNKQRDPSMDAVKVEIDVAANRISIYNNGDGVAVEIHQEEQVYVPELIFGHLLTSSNYDDDVKKTTGGRNGYGAKLTNIFSTEFIIETADGKRQKKYKQVFSDNMGKKSEPSITKCKERENWTKVTFKPDLAKFNMTYLEEDVVALMKKRVVDVAGTLGKSVKVELNGQRVPVKTFSDYVNLYLQSASKSRPEPLPRITEKVNERWEICVSLSEGQFQQVSFVNGIATIKGGTHVDYVTNQITNYIMAVVNKKNKSANLKAHNVRSHLWVFVNALIDNPAFDSQTKETLTTRQGSFGSKCELSEDLLKKVAKSGVVNTLLTWADFKQSKELKKTDGAKRQRITGIPKLEDANDAGGRNSEKCTLILTEGDSAKALAMAGISVVGRNYYGVFPLRGKLLNVREANHKQILENAEIQNIKQILGLQQGKEYESSKGLRYGHLMIMTDQDHDGSHIKGLLINFIHTFWPSLLKVPSFMVEFITPLLKATNNKTKTVLSFYSMPEYEAWKESLGGNVNGWSIKYYKGLGTSKSDEGKDYFKNIDKHKKEFVWADEHDGDAIELAFSKKKIEARKNWLRQFDPDNYLDQREKLIKYSDFINKELILFSRADLQRSIPSMVDGLKPGQRKILFCAFKRNFVKQAKVAQFVGYVSEKSAYHHGEQSLSTTIIGMAQDFVGSNNINLLQPEGQFGTRNQGGKDHASARYIFTCLSPITRFLFPKDDDILLDYLNEDGQSIEPSWYMPIIPLVLVNGSEGIGTGWSSYIPNYNPKDIVANIRRLLNNEPMQPMDPWYRGFKGRIEKSATKEAGVTYTITGIIEEVDNTTLRIMELPIRRWTQDYKEFLEAMMTRNDKIKEPFIKDYREYNDDKTVNFEVSLTEENMNIARQEGLEKKFKLTTTISTTNMHLFDAKGVIKKYDNPEQIIEEFFGLRYEFYEKRKKALLDNLELDLLKLDNKVRFILGVVRGEIIVNNRKRADLFLELQQKGFTPMPKKKGIDAAVAGATEEEEEEQEEEIPVVAKVGIKASDYEYLLSMPIGSLTLEKVQELCGEKEGLERDVEELRRTSPRTLWWKELDALEEELDVSISIFMEASILSIFLMYRVLCLIQKVERKDAEAEGVKETKMKTIAGVLPSKQGPKKPRKNLANNSSIDALSSTATDARQKKPKGGTKRAPAKKQTVEESDEDEDIIALKDRLAAYNLDSSPDHTAMETDALVGQGEKKKASRNKRMTTYSELSNEANEEEQLPTIEEDNDDDFSVVEAPKGGKGKGRKPKDVKAKSAATTSTKKGDQKLITEVFKPAENARILPQKVRKMRASPFNKNSGSVLDRLKNSPSASEDSSNSSSTVHPVEINVVATERTRPKRDNRKKAVYVLSDSEEDEREVATDDSDFDEDEV
ncbi:DNA topoisomerase 2-like [Canna indica]|uniref:DNA topoisomerase 2 n=1 Tax=Canna indica TaxID=4628 RepID=A0AAQ3K4L4_9LILI|nr:DNA topoisomerase 2-like [Canna indica]